MLAAMKRSQQRNSFDLVSSFSAKHGLAWRQGAIFKEGTLARGL